MNHPVCIHTSLLGYNMQIWLRNLKTRRLTWICGLVYNGLVFKQPTLKICKNTTTYRKIRRHENTEQYWQKLLVPKRILKGKKCVNNFLRLHTFKSLFSILVPKGTARGRYHQKIGKSPQRRRRCRFAPFIRNTVRLCNDFLSLLLALKTAILREEQGEPGAMSYPMNKMNVNIDICSFYFQSICLYFGNVSWPVHVITPLR